MDTANQQRAETTDITALGDILRLTKGLSHEDVQKALNHQREHGGRFGDAVVALGLAQQEDVVWALSQQFRYPFTPLSDNGISDELIVANAPFSDEAEAFRDLRSQLLLSTMNEQGRRRALAVVSAQEQDGKTLIAANLAIAFCQLPRRTLLIDANLRSPRLHELFGIQQQGLGLTSILAGHCEPNMIKPVGHLPNLYVLPAGVPAPNPTELLQRDSFALLLNDLTRKFDCVIVDTPSASNGSDARIVAAQCKSALVLGRKGWSPSRSLQTLVSQLNKNAVNIAGVVFNEH